MNGHEENDRALSLDTSNKSQTQVNSSLDSKVKRGSDTLPSSRGSPSGDHERDAECVGRVDARSAGVTISSHRQGNVGRNRVIISQSL